MQLESFVEELASELRVAPAPDSVNKPALVKQDSYASKGRHHPLKIGGCRTREHSGCSAGTSVYHLVLLNGEPRQASFKLKPRHNPLCRLEIVASMQVDHAAPIATIDEVIVDQLSGWCEARSLRN